MNKSFLSSSKIVIAGAVLLACLAGQSAFAGVCFTIVVGGRCLTDEQVQAGVAVLDAVNTAVNTVSVLETGLAATNADLATTKANLATTNANVATTNANLAATNADLATTKANLATTNANLATTNANLATANANLVAGDIATLNSANAHADIRAAETVKAANAYTDTRAAEILKSANAFTSEQVAKLASKTAGGVAAIAAMASVPQLTTGKSLSVGIGVGNHDGKTALSLGVHKRFNESMTARFNFASGLGSDSKSVVGAGAAWEF